MNAAPALLGYAAVVGVAAPYVMVRSAWPHRAPALGVTVWLALMLSFTLAAALAASSLATPTEHLHAGLVGLLHACGLGSGGARPVAPDPSTTGLLATALPGAVFAAVLGAFAHHLIRAGLLRARHRDRLDKVGVRSDRLGATVLPHGTPAAYCLPGFRSRVVVSDAAVRLLTDAQLEAVLEHERSHVSGRHHLPIAATKAFATVFPRVPLARHAREQMAVLVEMIADDRALRSHPDEVLATAMYEIAAGRTPRGAFGAGGTTALLRMRRILGPRRAPHPALRGSVASLAVAAPLLPLLVVCPPGV
ncbi:MULTISPECIES: M56 family metallopeptidase [Streptomyces]|uniref:M56 family metallopeptidase n=1 Tax=Streptomyces TaxID=1883 RepID=UPI000463FDDA|nr:M56 family metallopeptidase [Streptomyces exfoliatus]